MRGNLVLPITPYGCNGSIPARAGEPLSTGHPDSGRRVYPRACGGTTFSFDRSGAARGLSPRVRGNRAYLVEVLVNPGSIPARAGEPSQRHCCNGMCRVYPRACGGTLGMEELGTHLDGLSPRVRGNRSQALRLSLGIGSIPARAGEPFSILPSSGKPSDRASHRDTSCTAFYSWKGHRARPPFAE